MTPTTILAIKPPPGERRNALAVAAALLIACVIAAPFADLPGPTLSWYLPVVCAATVLVDLVTCYILFGQFVVSGAIASAILGAGYLFSATIVAFYLVSFPGIGGHGGWITLSAQAPSWLWIAWHAGFPLIVIAYATVERRKHRKRPQAWLFGPVLLYATAAFAFSLALGGALFFYSDRLPTLIVGHDYGGSVVTGIGLGTIAVNLISVVLILKRLRCRTLIQLWLAVAMLAFALATILTALGQLRYSLGWYLAPIVSLAGSGAVLLALLHEMTLLYAKLVRMQDTLETLVDTDSLTGLANRRHFNTTLQQQWLSARREGTPLSLIMADIDHFKAYNDALGHPAGDQCLQRIGGAVAETVHRPQDLAARYGGEEFALILPNTDAAGAREVAERLRAGAQALRIPQPAEPGAFVHISVGVATAVHPYGRSENDLLARSDAALYRAKREGRNRVVCADEPVPAPQFALAR